MKKTMNRESKSIGSTRSLGIMIVLAVIAAGVIVQLSRRQAAIPADEVTATEEGQASGTVAFLMEQQWLIRMKLAETRESRLSPQVTSTGRVVPAPQNHALVAPAVGGILRRPRFALRVSRLDEPQPPPRRRRLFEVAASTTGSTAAMSVSRG